MTRGRKKDLTIPPSRSLVQQRDYRARKAHYISGLEERCRQAEEENVQLRKELEETRARLANPAILLPETAEASSELMHNLALTRDSLAKFHQLAFPAPHAVHVQASSVHTQPPPLAYPTPPHFPQPLLNTQTAEGSGKKRLYVDDSSPSTTSTPASFHSPSPDLGEECCGGIFDCDELGCDSDDEETSGTRSRMSGLRSTTLDRRTPN